MSKIHTYKKKRTSVCIQGKELLKILLTMNSVDFFLKMQTHNDTLTHQLYVHMSFCTDLIPTIDDNLRINCKDLINKTEKTYFVSRMLTKNVIVH